MFFEKFTKSVMDVKNGTVTVPPFIWDNSSLFNSVTSFLLKNKTLFASWVFIYQYECCVNALDIISTMSHKGPLSELVLKVPPLMESI